MTTVNEVIQLRKQVEELKEKLARNKGMIEQLKKEQNGKSVVNLKTLREQALALESERVELEEKFEELLKVYQEKYDNS